ncbi:MAG: hypothetical protein R3D30_09835 [Hyphomicrobiales bacterium]
MPDGVLPTPAGLEVDRDDVGELTSLRRAVDGQRKLPAPAEELMP